MEEKDRFVYERMLLGQGYLNPAGIDEAGRGPLCGPVVAACVTLDIEHPIAGIRDSKKVSEKKRAVLFDEIREKAISCGIGIVSAEDIDRLNIRQATLLAMTRAMQAMTVRPDYIMVDGVDILPEYSGFPNECMRSLVGGDDASYLIGAASILAKETRDRILREMDEKYPEYGFAKHKGYGTKDHIEAIKKYGPCPEHRRSFITRIWP